MTLAIVRFVGTKITLKRFITVVYLHATVFSFAQTDVQKQMMYEYINSFSSSTLASIYPKSKPISNKEDLFNNAEVFPVYKIVLDKNDKTKLILDKNYYLVLYNNQLYSFIINYNYKSSYLRDNPIFKKIIQLRLESKIFKIAYLTDTFSMDRKYFNPLVVDIKLNEVIEKGMESSIEDYIYNKYGSKEKLRELQEFDFLRENLTLADFYSFIKTDYEYFNYNCPKDTTLILKTFINQIKTATKGFTNGQELRLLDRIKQKISPYEKVKENFKPNLKNDTSDNSISQLFNSKQQEYNKQTSNIVGFYEYKIYGVSITNELLEILTMEQFLDYKKYIDIRRPMVETLDANYNYKYRYQYGKEILSKAGIKYNNYIEFTDKILEECGCPYDETIEGRKKRIKIK